MNLKTQYSIFGGSAGIFVLILILLFLPQSGAESIPITPIEEQIISDQTHDNGTAENDDIPTNVGVLPAPPPPEEIVTEDYIEIIPIPESTTSSVWSSRSGGGGGGSSSNGDGDDNGDESFMVIPESPIGVIALLGTAFATIGAYAYIKRH